MNISASANDKKYLRPLIPHLGEKGVDTLAGYIDAKFRMNNETLLKKLVTKEDFAIVKRGVSRLETDVSFLKTDVAGLKTHVAGLKSDVSGLKTDVAGLKSDVSELKTDVSELREAVTNVRVAIPNLQTKMEIKLSDGKTEILRWMLTMFVVTMLALIGLYFKT